MRTTALVFLAAVTTAALAAGCSSTGNGPADVPPGTIAGVTTARSALQRDRAPSADSASVAEAVRGNHAFAADIYQRLAAGQSAGKNAFFSGYSISSAFAMLYDGARGETKNEIAKGLRFTLPSEKLHPAMNKIALDLESRAASGGKGSDGNGFRLAMNNSFWGEKKTSWEKPYLDTLAVHYDAGINLVDFVGNAESSRQKINAWTEAKTEKRIKELLPANSIRTSTRFVLVNTVYFNAAWLEEFAKADLSFTPPSGTASTVPAIQQTSRDIKFASSEDADVVAIPYEGRKLEMVVVVPKAIDAFERALDGAKLDALLDSPAPAYVDLTMPKVRIEGATISIADELKAMGLANIFGGDADFSGMSAGGLAIDNVYHQAFVKVNEKGTEAAAATAIVGRETSAPVDPPRKVLVDRPYMFFVRDVPTKQVLFTGRVLAPEYAE